MANLILPDIACLLEPNLLVPGRKPIGPVEVDWSHPLPAGGMSFIYAPNVLNKYRFTLTGATESHAGLDFDATTDRATSTLAALSSYKASAWVVVFTPRSYGSGSIYGRLFSNGTTIYAPEAYLREPTTGITWRIAPNGSPTYNWNTGGFTWGHKYCFVLATSGTFGTTRVWLYDLTDHVMQKSNTVGITGYISASANTDIFIGNRESPYDRGFDGIIELVAQFGGKHGWLHGDEVAADPYQFLKPAGT